ncbi:MAG: hypothetical protein R3Y56_05930 [Akkermansia sp.]
MSTINLTTSTKETIRTKVAEELKFSVCMLDDGSGYYWSHEFNEDGSRKDTQSASGGGVVFITVTFS